MRRRTLIAAAGASALASAVPSLASAASPNTFPKGFLWGAATAAYQVEGNNLGSDMWLLEHVKPSLFAETSGDAANSFELWRTDLDLVKRLGLTTYRFSLEWGRIEPEPGQFSVAMLDHYKAMIRGCRERGLTPVVTFNHFTTPVWFAARGGWTATDAPDLFARYCERAARHLAGEIAYATTLNEPDIMNLLGGIFPPQVLAQFAAMDAAAGHAVGSTAFRNPVVLPDAERNLAQTHLLAAHKKGREAIKSVRPQLPVGFSLALQDEEAEGPGSLRDLKRKERYGAWLEAAKGGDFMGVQNYTRVRWDAKGPLPPPDGAKKNSAGEEIYPASLANAVRYAHQETGVPILVTEHGVCAEDDGLRAAFIPAALGELHKVIADGVPVLGYIHWSLIDNFEWFFGYKRRYGLCSVDRTTFVRTPKPSSRVLGAIARHNAV